MSKNKQKFFRPSPPVAPKPPKRPIVVVAVLTGPERRDWPCPFLTAAVVNIAFDPRVQMAYLPIHAVHPVDAARNLAVKEFFKFNSSNIGDAEWLIMFDNDIGPPMNVIDVVLSAPDEADIIILPYWVWQPQGPMLCFGKWEGGKMVTPDVGELKPGWNEGGTGGTGAIFIRRRVFTDGRMTEPFFQIHSTATEGQVMSEDVHFTSLAKEAGMRIFTHTEFICSHYRTADLAEVNAWCGRVLRQYVERAQVMCKEQGVEVPGLAALIRPELFPKR